MKTKRLLNISLLLKPYLKHLKIHYVVNNYANLFGYCGYFGSNYYFIEDFKLCASSTINIMLLNSF